MKKNKILLLVSLICTPILASCSFNGLLYMDFSNLNDVDPNTYIQTYTTPLEKQPSVNLPSSYENINIKYRDKYLDLYNRFDTQYLSRKKIELEVPTGVPQRISYLPIGMPGRLMGSKNKDTMFKYYKSVYEWQNPSNDYKYSVCNSSPIIPTSYVASKWVASQTSNMKYLAINHPMTICNDENWRSIEEPLCHTDATYETRSLSSANYQMFQYSDYYLPWNGDFNNILNIPTYSEIFQCHKNGVKIFANFFIDQWHNANVSDIANIFDKNVDGSYKFADVLIQLALFFGFDGWFFNLEFYQDRDIMLNVANIIRQAQNIIDDSSDYKIHNLKLITYTSYGCLKKGDPYYDTSKYFAESSNNNFVQDFNGPANDVVQYIKDEQCDKSNIFAMYNPGWSEPCIFSNYDGLGTRDVRSYTKIHYKPDGSPYTGSASDVTQEREDRDNNKWTYKDNEDYQCSLAVFANNTAYDETYVNSKNWNGAVKSLSEDVWRTMCKDYMNPMIFTGNHRYLTNEDEGITSWDLQTPIPPNSSYGIGNFHLEKTVLYDGNSQNHINEFKTNFSNGSGKMFVSDDGNCVNNYPWHNDQLMDYLPTYMWDIKDKDNKPINYIDGYYDYYQAVAKGNSVALGDLFRKTIKLHPEEGGQIHPVKFQDDVLWNIMGTNYFSNDKLIDMQIMLTDISNRSFTIDQIKSNFDISLALTFDDNTIDKIKINDLLNNTSTHNNWVNFECDLSSHDLHGKRIGKIGLYISPNATGKNVPIKFNVGEIKINPKTPITHPMPVGDYINNLDSDCVIERKKYTNMRLNWSLNDINKDLIDYFEIYLQDDSGIYRLGETINPNFFVNNLNLTSRSKILIKTVNKYNSADNKIQGWNIF